MPNWARGPFDVTGTKDAVRAFAQRFIFPDKPCTVDGVKYFARTFLYYDRNETMEEIEDAFQGVPETEEREFRFYPDFAWSAYSCVVSGYPEEFQDACMTLKYACIHDKVDVHIRTTEPGMCFEEDIFCDRTGALTCDCKSLARVARCKACGNELTLASFESPDDLDCCECGGTEFEIQDE